MLDRRPGFVLLANSPEVFAQVKILAEKISWIVDIFDLKFLFNSVRPIFLNVTKAFAEKVGLRIHQFWNFGRLRIASGSRMFSYGYIKLSILSVRTSTKFWTRLTIFANSFFWFSSSKSVFSVLLIESIRSLLYSFAKLMKKLSILAVPLPGFIHFDTYLWPLLIPLGAFIVYVSGCAKQTERFFT